MADLKITQLTALLTIPDDADLFEIVDVSDPTMDPAGTNKKITWAQLKAGLFSGSGTVNRMPIFTSASAIGDSTFQQGTNSFEPIASGKNLGANTVNGRWSNYYTAGNVFAQDNFTINIAATNVMYFRDSQKVGIRESNPSAVFEIKGLTSVNTGKALMIKDVSDVEKFTFTDDGRLGILQGLPTARFEINSGATKPALFTSSTQADLLHIHTNGIVVHSAVSPEAAFQIRSNASSPNSGRALKVDTFNVFGALNVEADGSKFMANQAAPAGTPSFGGYLYVVAGSLWYKGSAGTTTQIALA